MQLKQTLLTITLAACLISTAAIAAVPAAAPVAKVNLNKADVKSLMQIQGMSAYKAHAIIAYRHKNGDFKNFNELEKVKGFKRMTPESMKQMTEKLEV